jgi:tetratricopeptide (TPR) repeat protein
MKLSILISLMLLSAIASQLLPNTTSVSRAESAQRRSPDNRQVVSNNASTTKLIYFPRRGEARHCFITKSRGNMCIFRDYLSVNTFPILPVLDLSLEYRKAELMAEIAAKYAAAKRYERATLVTKLAVDKPLSKALALTAIATEYAQAGQTNLAEQRLSEALETAKTANVLPKITALPRIAAQYAAIGQTQTASQIFELARQTIFEEKTNLYLQASSVGELVVGLLAAGQTTEAEKMMRELLQAIEKDKSPQKIYPWLFTALLDAGQYDFAIRLVKDVRNPTLRNRWLSDICNSLADAGEYDRAIQVAQTLPDQALFSRLSQRASFLNTLNDIVKLAEAGNFADALSSAELIQLPYYKALVLTQIAIAFTDAGQATQAKETLSKAVPIARTIKGIEGNPGDGGGLVLIAVSLAEAGKFSEALEITNLIQDESYKVLVMLNIAQQYIKIGQNNKALETLSETSKLVSSLRCKICDETNFDL